MGRLRNEGTKERDQVEAALAALAGSMLALEEVLLRNEQAMRRTPVVEDVLRPAVERIRAIQKDIREAQREMGEVWSKGQIKKWSE